MIEVCGDSGSCFVSIVSIENVLCICQSYKGWFWSFWSEAVVLTDPEL